MSKLNRLTIVVLSVAFIIVILIMLRDNQEQQQFRLEEFNGFESNIIIAAHYIGEKKVQYATVPTAYAAFALDQLTWGQFDTTYHNKVATTLSLIGHIFQSPEDFSAEQIRSAESFMLKANNIIQTHRVESESVLLKQIEKAIPNQIGKFANIFY